MSSDASREAVIDAFARRHRFRPAEAAPWLLALAAYMVFPGYLPLSAQILATILFVLSADLVLGYAGIVTLGHAAFFGAGAYTAGLLAANGWGEPLSGLLAASLVAALIGFPERSPHFAHDRVGAVDADPGRRGDALRGRQQGRPVDGWG